MIRPMIRLAKVAIIIAGAALTAAGQLAITTKGPLPTAIVGADLHSVCFEYDR